MLKMKNLPIILLVGVVLYVLYTSDLVHTVKGMVGGAVDTTLDAVGLGHDEPAHGAAQAPTVDLGMYDSYNPNAFGTTAEEERRITNDGVRKEYHHNPFPYAECTCHTGHCDKHGVPEPTMGHTHICKNGFPSKRIVDSYGGHFQLNHICAGPSSDECSGEPTVLGRWWCRSCGANPESIGLNVRPACTRCN